MAHEFPNPDQQWIKGQSGNPRGRPPGRSFKAARAFLAAAVGKHPAIEDIAAHQLIWMMLQGNIHACKLLIDWEAAEARREERERARGGS